MTESLTWYLDDYQTPQSLGPLAQSLYPHIFEGFESGQRERGAENPGRLLYQLVKGWLYVHFKRPGPNSDRAKAAAHRTPLRWEQEWLPEIQTNLDRLEAVELTPLSDEALRAHLADALQALTRHWEIHHALAYGAIVQFTEWFKGRFPGAPDAEVATLLQGHANMSVKAADALWRLARQVTPEITALLEAGRLTTLPADFRAALHSYLDTYGRRTAGYCDIGSPTWLEDPTPVLPALLALSRAPVQSPMARLTEHQALQQAFATRVESQLRPDEIATFRTNLDLARKAHQLREDHAYWIELRTVAAVRHICAEFGRRLAPVDVALLTLDELLSGALPSEAELENRRVTWAENQEAKPAPWVGATPDEEEEPLAKATAWRGKGISPGQVTAPVRVATCIQEARAMKPGEILVAVETNPDWTPYMLMAGGLVLDRGSSFLSHAAIVAREFQLPAVIGCCGIVGNLKTGDHIRLDGTTGEVVRL